MITLCRWGCIQAVFLSLCIMATVCWAQPLRSPGRVGPLLAAIHDEQPAAAVEALGEIEGTFSDEERVSVLEALRRLAPAGEWLPFLEAMAEREPGEAEYTYLLARANWRAGDDDAALRWGRKTVELAPRDGVLLYRSAAIAYAVNNYDLAREWLQKLLDLEPNNPDGNLLLGTVLARMGHDDEARAQLKKAEMQAPDNQLVLFELGKLANRAGESAEAEDLLKRAISNYPFFREAYTALLVALSRQGKTEEVMQTQETYNYLRDWPAAKLNRVWYVFRNPDQASPEDAQALAVELSKVNRPDLATRYLNHRVANNLASPMEKLLLARLAYNEQEFGKAATLIHALDEGEFHESALYALLRVLIDLRTGRLDDARVYYNSAKTRFADSEEIQNLESAFQAVQPAAEIGSASSGAQTSAATSEARPGDIRFTDASERSGLTAFKHRLGHPDKRWITDAMGSGVAVGDYDGDGDDDVYFCNGRPELDKADPAYHNALFRNNDDGTFTDVTDEAGVGDTGYGMCAAFGDVDGDGDLDLYSGNIGANVMYRNNGDGTFTDITIEAGVGDDGYAAAAVFGDVDNDGDLDLYVGNYVAFDPKTHGESRINYEGEQVFMGPLPMPPQPDRLYINDGKGVFMDRAEEAGFPSEYGRAMGAVFFDMDNDGDLDLYIANDSTFNFVLQNKGDGTFEDISLPSGGAFTESGVEGASMGVGPGDFNNDGFTDIYITSYEKQTDVLFENTGGEYFVDVTSRAGLSADSRMLITWGVAWGDFNADGWLDAITANGHMYPQVDSLNLGRSYNQGVSIYRNREGRFDDATASALAAQPEASGRGLALFDYDGDGDLDVVINNIDSTPTLLENRSVSGAWLEVRLDASSADMFGARAVARKGDRTWTRSADGGSGYLSQNSQTLHFGFGEMDAIDDLTIYWRGAEPQVIKNPPLFSKIQVKKP
ncbi:MAG: tetratricopeptide repeat protein [bacterium]|nr:tetratricopeptide repeat protein [bacterium]